jgi:hypothetical protein
MKAVAATLLALTGAAHADATVPAPPAPVADYVLDDELRTRKPPAPPERTLVFDFTGVQIESRLQPPTRFQPLLRKQEPEVRELDALVFVDDALRAGEPAGGRTVVKRPKPEPRKRNLNVGAGR